MEELRGDGRKTVRGEGEEGKLGNVRLDSQRCAREGLSVQMNINWTMSHKLLAGLSEAGNKCKATQVVDLQDLSAHLLQSI